MAESKSQEGDKRKGGGAADKPLPSKAPPQNTCVTSKPRPSLSVPGSRRRRRPPGAEHRIPQRAGARAGAAEVRGPRGGGGRAAREAGVGGQEGRGRGGCPECLVCRAEGPGHPGATRQNRRAHPGAVGVRVWGVEVGAEFERNFGERAWKGRCFGARPWEFFWSWRFFFWRGREGSERLLGGSENVRRNVWGRELRGPLGGRGEF